MKYFIRTLEKTFRGIQNPSTKITKTIQLKIEIRFIRIGYFDNHEVYIMSFPRDIQLYTRIHEYRCIDRSLFDNKNLFMSKPLFF